MPAVVSGLERLLREGAAAAGLSRGARVALLAHAAAVDSAARHAVELLRAAGELDLALLLAPEHGLYGHEQDMEAVDATRDPASGLPVLSLYGADAGSLRPDPARFSGLDAVLFDCQDVGSRYYTYAATLSYLMQAAGKADVPVVVLDRPNPIGGMLVEGPVLEPGLSSFVGPLPIPVRHGMTVGELAGMFCGEFGIACDLRVVPMHGWRRAMDFDATGLPWVPPSPNMPTPATARVYPGGCLVEGTNLSEGRGTTTPFELVGAPWLDGAALVAALRAAAPAGVAFRAASFRPMFQKHAGSACGGVQVIVCDRERFEPFATYLLVLREARRLAPDRFDWRHEVYEFERERLEIDLLLGAAGLRPLLERGASLEEMRESWAPGLARFGELRRRYLLY